MGNGPSSKISGGGVSRDKKARIIGMLDDLAEKVMTKTGPVELVIEIQKIIKMLER